MSLQQEKAVAAGHLKPTAGSFENNMNDMRFSTGGHMQVTRGSAVMGNAVQTIALVYSLRGRDSLDSLGSGHEQQPGSLPANRTRAGCKLDVCGSMQFSTEDKYSMKTMHI